MPLESGHQLLKHLLLTLGTVFRLPDLGLPLLRRVSPPVTTPGPMVLQTPQNERIQEIFLDDSYSDQEDINNGTYQPVPTTDGNVSPSLATNHPGVVPDHPLVTAAPVDTLLAHDNNHFTTNQNNE